MAKRTTRNKRKNQRERAGRAKTHGLPAKAVEERRSRPPAKDVSKKRTRAADESDDDRTSDAGDSEPPRSRKAPAPPFSQNMVFIGAAIIVVLGVAAYFWSKSSGQPQRAAPEPGSDERPPITLQLPPTPPGSGRTLAPPVMTDPPGGAEEEKEKEAPPEKEKEEEKEKEKPSSAPTKPPAPKVSPKPTNAAPKPTAPAAPAPKPGDNPY